jgi:hypothetical protein
MAEAGAIAEFMDWLRRKPAFSIPSARAAVLPPSLFRIVGIVHPNTLEISQEPETGFFGRSRVELHQTRIRMSLMTPTYSFDVGDVIAVSGLANQRL